MEKRKTKFIAIGVLAALLFGPGLVNLLILSFKNHKEEAKIKRLEAQYEKLIDERDRLKNDPTYVEDLARSTFKVARPGELVVPIEPETAKKSPK
jgi:cell division protein FtsB